jgi:hypothetical protein
MAAANIRHRGIKNEISRVAWHDGIAWQSGIKRIARRRRRDNNIGGGSAAWRQSLSLRRRQRNGVALAASTRRKTEKKKMVAINEKARQYQRRKRRGIGKRGAGDKRQRKWLMAAWRRGIGGGERRGGVVVCGKQTWKIKRSALASNDEKLALRRRAAT